MYRQDPTGLTKGNLHLQVVQRKSAISKVLRLGLHQRKSKYYISELLLDGSRGKVSVARQAVLGSERLEKKYSVQPYLTTPSTWKKGLASAELYGNDNDSRSILGVHVPLLCPTLVLVQEYDNTYKASQEAGRASKTSRPILWSPILPSYKYTHFHGACLEKKPIEHPAYTCMQSILYK